ncbi:MAG: hypothetical protein AAGG51_00660 [Cyanobacteria bacterium P01_G01_bin.54]
MRLEEKQGFAIFILPQAYQLLGIETLELWAIPEHKISPTAFFEERLKRLRTHFDLRYCEKSKELLIDAFCEEALEGVDRLKIWKGAKLESKTTTGNIDYLVAPRKDYLDTPFLCIVEAKKDDFEQGLAQCLAELKACQKWNQEQDLALDIVGIATNGEGWRFYQLSVNQQVKETLLYSSKEVDLLLGVLHDLFKRCQDHLITQAAH